MHPDLISTTLFRSTGAQMALPVLIACPCPAKKWLEFILLLKSTGTQMALPDLIAYSPWCLLVQLPFSYWPLWSNWCNMETMYQTTHYRQMWNFPPSFEDQNWSLSICPVLCEGILLPYLNIWEIAITNVIVWRRRKQETKQPTFSFLFVHLILK